MRLALPPVDDAERFRSNQRVWQEAGPVESADMYNGVFTIR